MLTLLHHAVKHFTPLWQRNLSLLFAVSFMGMTLSLFLLLPKPNSSILNIPFFTDLDQGSGSAELAEVHVGVVVDRGNRVPVLYVTPQRDLVCPALPSSLVSRPLPHPPLDLAVLLHEELNTFMVRPEDVPESVQRLVERQFGDAADQ